MSEITMDTLTTHKALRWGLVGKSGSGKTRTAATAPAPFFLDGEKGVSGARDLLVDKVFGGVEIVESGTSGAPKAWHHTMAVLGAFEEGDPFKWGESTINPKEYKTFVVDTWTTIGQYAFSEGVAEARRNSKSGKESMLQAYGYYELYGKAFANKLLTISDKNDMNIIVNFHLKPGITDDDGNVVKWDPYFLGKGLPPYLLAILDETWAMEARHAGPNTKLVAHTGNFMGIDVLKSRHHFPPIIEDPNLTTLLESIRGE